MHKKKVPIVVISDVHLGSGRSKADALLAYLKSVQTQILIINGDFLDQRDGRKKYFPSAHFEVIRRILKMMNQGTKVYYITGNHDTALRGIGGLLLGNAEIMDELVLPLADGKKAWFFHGDKYDAVLYKEASWMLKWMGHSQRSIHLLKSVFNFLAPSRSSAREKLREYGTKASVYVDKFESIIGQRALAKNMDYVCVGHTHYPTIRCFSNDNSATMYLNSGDWISNLTSLEYDGEKCHLITHKAKSLSTTVSENNNHSPDIYDMRRTFLQTIGSK